MYIKEENGKVIIYEVRINNELEKIRDEMIEKFSDITEYEEERTYWNDTLKTKKGMEQVVSYKYTGKMREYNDFYSSDEKIYLVKFKKYKYPDIVVYINEFLNMNFKNLSRIKEILKPRKIYRINDENREFLKNLLLYKEYIKRIINCIELVKVKEKEITSLADLLDLLSDIDDKKIKDIYDSIKGKLEKDSKKLSYLMGEDND